MDKHKDYGIPDECNVTAKERECGTNGQQNAQETHWPDPPEKIMCVYGPPPEFDKDMEDMMVTPDITAPVYGPPPVQPIGNRRGHTSRWKVATVAGAILAAATIVALTLLLAQTCH